MPLLALHYRPAAPRRGLVILIVCRRIVIKRLH
jgi:hypothetical protein